MRHPFVVLSLMLLTVPLPAIPANPNTLYDIEVLVFENLQPGLEGGETWKEPQKTPDNIEAAALPEGAPAPDSALSQAAEALGRGGQHRILAHKRWQQNVDAKAETAPLRLQGLDNGLDGTVRFYFNRSLYLELQLALHSRQDTAGAKIYSLSEHRRVRPQETHYFDHPKLGALVRITAVGKPETPQPAKKKAKPSR